MRVSVSFRVVLPGPARRGDPEVTPVVGGSRVGGSRVPGVLSAGSVGGRI